MLLFQWTWFKGINCIEARNNSDDYKAQGNYQCIEFSTMIYSTSNILRLTRLDLRGYLLLLDPSRIPGVLYMSLKILEASHVL